MQKKRSAKNKVRFCGKNAANISSLFWAEMAACWFHRCPMLVGPSAEETLRDIHADNFLSWCGWLRSGRRHDRA
jgi:hypothetical protein